MSSTSSASLTTFFFSSASFGVSATKLGAAFTSTSQGRNPSSINTSKPYVSKQFSCSPPAANDVFRNFGAHANTLFTTTFCMFTNSVSTASYPNRPFKHKRNARKSNFCAFFALYPSAVLFSATLVRCARKSRRDAVDAARELFFRSLSSSFVEHASGSSHDAFSEERGRWYLRVLKRAKPARCR